MTQILEKPDNEVYTLFKTELYEITVPTFKKLHQELNNVYERLKGLIDERVEPIESRICELNDKLRNKFFRRKNLEKELITKKEELKKMYSELSTQCEDKHYTMMLLETMNIVATHRGINY